MKKRVFISILGLLGVGLTSCEMYGPAPVPINGPESSMYHPSERVEDEGIDIVDDSETDNENPVEE